MVRKMPVTQLDDQYDHRQYAKDIPDVEVFARVVFGRVLFHHLAERESGIDPRQQSCAPRLSPVASTSLTLPPPYLHQSAERIVANKAVRRHDQVGRRRHAGKYTTGEVELGTVTRDRRNHLPSPRRDRRVPHRIGWSERNPGGCSY